jgi:hypothetical protein
VAVRVHGDDGDRGVGVLLGDVRLPPGNRGLKLLSADALNFERRSLGDEARLIAECAQSRLHQIGAEVVEQQEPAQQGERRQQDCRDEADEDVGQDQLAANAP